MIEQTRLWVMMVVAMAAVAACDGGSICFAVTQNELEAKLADEGCFEVRVLDFDSERLEATTERDDVELFIDADYCVAFNQCQADGPVLTLAEIDNIPVNVAEIDSVAITRYRGGQVLATHIDLTLGEAPTLSPNVGPTVLNAGSLRLRATVPMDGWRRMSVGAVPSWEGVSVEVDPSAHSTTTLEFSGDGLNLAQLQQFGAKAREVSVGLSADVAQAYASWLESEGFTGTLTVAVDGESVVMLPRATNP